MMDKTDQGRASKPTAIERIERELARINRGLAVLECIRFKAMHNNCPGSGALADALTLPLEDVSSAADRLDALTLELHTGTPRGKRCKGGAA